MKKSMILCLAILSVNSYAEKTTPIRPLVTNSSLEAASNLTADQTWACEIVLCLSNPKGPTAVNECKSPVAKYKNWLKHNNGIPHCPNADAHIRTEKYNVCANNTTAFATQKKISEGDKNIVIYIPDEKTSGEYKVLNNNSFIVASNETYCVSNPRIVPYNAALEGIRNKFKSPPSAINKSEKYVTNTIYVKKEDGEYYENTYNFGKDKNNDLWGDN